MATYGWGTDCRIVDWLFHESYRFDFYQAVRLLELSKPGSAPLGEGVRPEREAVVLGSSIRRTFPSSDIEQLTPLADGDKRPKVVVNFMGLAGHFGPLPEPYSDYVTERVKAKDFALRDFLDVFNHRLLSIMYRMRKRTRVGFDGRSPEDSHYASYLYSLIGMGTKGMQRRLKIEDRAILRYAGLLASQPHSSAGLRQMLQDHFRLPVTIRCFVGQWLPLEASQLTAIGVENARNNTLGDDATLGTKVWDQRSRLEVTLGPLNRSAFATFLPIGQRFGMLLALVNLYVGTEHDVEITLVLNKEAVPDFTLDQPGRIRLGWNSWLGKNTRQEFRITISPSRLVRQFVNLLWHNDFAIDAALERMPNTVFER